MFFKESKPAEFGIDLQVEHPIARVRFTLGRFCGCQLDGIQEWLGPSLVRKHSSQTSKSFDGKNDSFWE
jgi:hypothetical protein